CRREPAMVERAVKSVIAQTYTDWNLVVVDDSPNDYEFREDVRKMVEGYAAKDSRIRYVPHDKNYGAQRARNTALKIAGNTDGGGGHEFIAYLDDDDEWLPEKLEKQIARFAECGDSVGLVYCSLYYVDDDLQDFRKTAKFSGMGTEGKVFPTLIEGNFIAMLTLIRTKYLIEAGGFDETMPALQDWEAWLRLSLCCDFAYVNEPLAIVYKKKGREHVLGSYTRIIKAFENIEDKYKDYLSSNQASHVRFMKNLLQFYVLNGEYRQFFSVWLKIFHLQPHNKLGSISLIPQTLRIFMKEKMKSLLFMISPRLFFALKRRQYRKKGDNLI
ncbi:MAG: glycosyltransferase family 2 protein, partial [Synergistaceae bacterium]|nr:glycosyltransferase family 2 protein [Synergistaceae bacterium]